MNVTVENLAPCKKLVRIDLDDAAVDAAFAEVEKSFTKEASLPGFRPGKAPRDLVLKKYEAEITAEVKRKLIPDAYRQAVKEQNLNVVGYPDIEEIQFARGQALQFAATLETAPEFALPEYRGLPTKRETSAVTEADVERALDMLRDRQANFQKLDRAAQDGDFVVVNYTGTCDGKPISETAPTARGLTEQKAFWIELKKDSFIPGFSEQLTSAKAGDQRAVNIDFAADFVTKELAGKKGVFAVEVVEVKERTLPAMDDAFAKTYGAEDLAKLRAGVRADLQNELNSKQTRDLRNQVAKGLLDQVACELPESLVAQETRNIVYQIVQENQGRGITKEAIDQQKDQIYGAANLGAKERVKASFVFQRVAEKEGIKVSREEINQRIYALSQSYQMAPDKFVKELEKRDGVSELYGQLLNEKVIDFLQQHSKIEDVAPAPAPAVAPAA